MDTARDLSHRGDIPQPHRKNTSDHFEVETRIIEERGDKPHMSVVWGLTYENGAVGKSL